MPAGRPPGAKNIAPRIRAVFTGLTSDETAPDYFNLRKAMKESLDKDFLGTLRVIKGFVPIELLLQGDDANPDEIEQVFRLELVAPDGRLIDILPTKVEYEALPAPMNGGNGHT